MWTPILALCLIGLAMAELIRVPLKRVENPKRKSLKTGRWTASNKQQIRLSDYSLLGNITIGTPDQSFTIFFDTGTTDLRVEDKNCQFCDDGQRTFDGSKSSTYKLIDQYNDTNGYDLIIVGQDVVKIGASGMVQLPIPKSRFWQMANPQSIGPDGIFGLALGPLSYINETPPIINAVNQGLLDRNLFTIFSNDTAGQITFGALDNDNCKNDINYFPLSSSSYWQFKFSGVQFGSYSSTQQFQAVSYSSIGLIGVPSSEIFTMAAIVGATYDNTYEAWFVDCDAQMPDFHITFGNTQYTIPGKELTSPEGEAKNLCFWLFFTSDDWSYFGPDTWVLGDMFLYKYCSIYDIGQKRIGFASHKYN